MLRENRPVGAPNAMLRRPPSVPGRQRARKTNNPLAGTSRNTAQGRRIGDLFLSYCEVLGNPSDPPTQAAVLAAAELTYAAEAARARLLSDDSEFGDIALLVRLENLAARALKRLGIKPGAVAKPHVPLRSRLGSGHG
jgi:hypothetical protein